MIYREDKKILSFPKIGIGPNNCLDIQTSITYQHNKKGDPKTAFPFHSILMIIPRTAQLFYP